VRFLFQSASSKCTLTLLVCQFFVVARGSASLLLSTDGRGHFQTHEEPLNDVEALSILKVHFEIKKWHFEFPKCHFELFNVPLKVRIKCVQAKSVLLVPKVRNKNPLVAWMVCTSPNQARIRHEITKERLKTSKCHFWIPKWGRWEWRPPPGNCPDCKCQNRPHSAPYKLIFFAACKGVFI
jgi:hypothetical protein